MLIAFFCLTLATLANSFANILLKKASTIQAATLLETYLNPLFIGGLFLFGLNLLFYSRSLKDLPLATAYPLLVGGSLIIVTCVAHFWLKEPLLMQHVAGIGLIMAGLYLVV